MNKHQMRIAWAVVVGGVVGLVACPKTPASTEDAGVAMADPWKPGVVLPTPREPNARGLLDRRGLIHAHSYFSHDACDNAPVDDAGVRDEVCFEDFRRGLCQSKHDFVFLTDHRDAFNHTEYPDTLLYRPERGDVLLTENGSPVASWAMCDDGSQALIMAGCEGTTMPVGLSRHAAATPDERNALYSGTAAADIEQLKAAGAVALVPHTENWTVEQLITMPLDGFEMFNLHANTVRNAGAALTLLVQLGNTPEVLPHPDLLLLPIVDEDPTYLSTWGTVLARGARRITTMGTDCHRNTFPQILPDGERVDSYRRMMIGFSNHLLVRPRADGTYSDVELKEALRAGRLFGVFEYLGFPLGFEFTAEGAQGVVEMGAAVALAEAPVLRVVLPSVMQLDPHGEQPVLRARLLRAVEGGWEVAAEGDGDLAFTPVVAGAYRAEIRMQPKHLREFAGAEADVLVERDQVWIYGNPIYVEP